MKGQNTAKVVELFLDPLLYERLKERARVDGVTESEALLQSFRRGMGDFTLHVMADNIEDYEIISRLVEKCERDNALLKAIESQNEYLHGLLKNQERGRESQD